MSSTAPGQARPGDRVDGDCQICRRTTLTILPFRYAFEGRFLLGAECSTCGLVFLHPMLSDDEIAGLYTEEYFTECGETVGAHGPAAYMDLVEHSEEGRRRSAAKLDAKILRHLKGRGEFLEIGCGPGFFLLEIDKLGWKTRGLDISEYAVRHAKETLGLNAVQGSIEGGLFHENTFDAIFMGDVLEHLPRPMESLRIVRTWLKPGGMLLVAIPSTLNLLSAKLGMLVYGARKGFKTLRIPPYHLFEYKPKTIRALLVAAGFRVLELDQSAVPLRKMGLRGSPVENAGKAALQVGAHLTSSLVNRWGDRLLAVAGK